VSFLDRYKIPRRPDQVYFCILPSVMEPHHFYAAPALGKNFDAAPAAPAQAPTPLYSKAKFLK
jgi:hypothetical protein